MYGFLHAISIVILLNIETPRSVIIHSLNRVIFEGFDIKERSKKANHRSGRTDR